MAFKSILLALIIGFLGSTATANQPNNVLLFDDLSKLSGEFKLVKNNGCLFNSGVDEKAPFSMSVDLIDRADKDFGIKVGDLEAALMQNGSKIFDRTKFFRINQSTVRNRVGTLFISHWSTLSKDSRVLTHKVSMYQIGSGGTFGRQSITANKDFSKVTYSHILGTINRLGFSKDDKSTITTCEFERI